MAINLGLYCLLLSGLELILLVEIGKLLLSAAETNIYVIVDHLDRAIPIITDRAFLAQLCELYIKVLHPKRARIILMVTGSTKLQSRRRFFKLR